MTITAARLRRFERYYTPLVSDTLDRLGLPGGKKDKNGNAGFVMNHVIQHIAGGVQPKICGIAFPCRVVPTKKYVEIDKLLAMVDSIPANAIVVVAADADIGAALWGGLMSAGAMRRGARAAVVNGGVRDIEQIEALRFPVFGEYTCVTDIRRRGYMAEFNIKVNCGGVNIKPGDVIFADANGVVVIPQEHFDLVETELHAANREERSTMQGLAKGETAKKLFAKYKRF